MLLAAVRVVCLRSFMSATLVARNELSHCASFPVCVTIMLDEMASYNVSHGLLRACPGVGRDSRYSVSTVHARSNTRALATRETESTVYRVGVYGARAETDRSVRSCVRPALCRVSSRVVCSSLDARHTTVGRRPRGAHSLSLQRGVSAGAGQRERECVSLQYSTACRDLVCSGFNILMTLCFMSQVLGVW